MNTFTPGSAGTTKSKACDNFSNKIIKDIYIQTKGDEVVYNLNNFLPRYLHQHHITRICIFMSIEYKQAFTGRIAIKRERTS